jgi:hypothetical protein
MVSVESPPIVTVLHRAGSALPLPVDRKVHASRTNPAKRSVRLAPPQREEQRFHNLGNKPSSPCVRNGSRNIGFGFGSTISVILLALEKQDGFDIR